MSARYGPDLLFILQVTQRDRKKVADKDRKEMERALQIKAAALQDDDNVFDVAFERQGEDTESTLSTTDIKVRLLAPALPTGPSVLCRPRSPVVSLAVRCGAGYVWLSQGISTPAHPVACMLNCP